LFCAPAEVVTDGAPVLVFVKAELATLSSTGEAFILSH
jgi:hypothetical protein